MAKIKSNIELLYNSREGKKGIIKIEISEWKFELSNNRYSAVVNDYLSIINVINEVEVENLELIHTKINFYSKIEIDTIFNYLNNSIETPEVFSDELDILISMALLLETQAKPIYESLSDNWELCE